MMLILKYCFYYKRHKTLFLLSLYQQTTIKNYQYFLAHGLEDQCNGMTIKQKVRKNTTNEYRYFLESSFVGAHRRFFICPNKNNSVKHFNAKKCYLNSIFI